jgi:transcriptional regulator with XRE-family HTH domain
MNEPTGERLRTLRGRRTQKAIAELAGISPMHLSNLEHGRRRLDSRLLIGRLATALGVSPSDIVGAPWGADNDLILTAARQSVPAIRTRLLDTVVGEPDGPARPLPELEHEVGRMQDRFYAGSYDELATMLPGLMGALHTVIATGDKDRSRACQLLFIVSNAACGLLRSLGFADLAWVAAQRGHDATLASEDPAWQAIGVITSTHSLVTAGAIERAHVVAEAAADRASRLSGQVGSEPVDGVHGGLLLASSFTAAATGRAVEAAMRLDEAGRMADRTGQLGRDAMLFGPTQIAMARVSIAAERGDGRRVAELAQQTHPDPGTPPIRLSGYLTNVARGLSAVRGQDSNAVRALRQAEQIAPQQVRANVLARELVPDLITRARRPQDRRWLRSFAVRVGTPI